MFEFLEDNYLLEVGGGTVGWGSPSRKWRIMPSPCR